VQVAERTIEWMGKEKYDAIVIDGDGLGAGVIDQINFRGFGQRLFEFHGGTAANDSAAYFNRSAECWERCATGWLWALKSLTILNLQANWNQENMALAIKGKSS